MAAAHPARRSNTVYIEALLRRPTGADHIQESRQMIEQNIRDNLSCICLGQVIYTADNSKSLHFVDKVILIKSTDWREVFPDLSVMDYCFVKVVEYRGDALPAHIIEVLEVDLKVQVYYFQEYVSLLMMWGLVLRQPVCCQTSLSSPGTLCYTAMPQVCQREDSTDFGTAWSLMKGSWIR